MNDPSLICPRCFASLPASADLKFCPRCGLSDVLDALRDTSPMLIRIGGQTYSVEERFAVGSVANLYRCRFEEMGRKVEGVCKVARDARVNPLLANEADILRRLHHLDAARRYGAFLPQLAQTFTIDDSDAPSSRVANVLRMRPEIKSPCELYSLDEVRSQYPSGLDGRDVAWIWRRLLNVLGFVHSCQVAHGAVLPMHVLIDPKDHKLVLIDWCAAACGERSGRAPAALVGGGYSALYRRLGAGNLPPNASLDLALGARCMIELLGGDPLEMRMPDSVEAGLQRHFQRCGESQPGQADAWRALGDFDKLIEALWGPRRFRTFSMPPRTSRT